MRITQNHIQRQIDALNEVLGTNYRTDYSPYYGGYNLYVVTNGGGHNRDYLGFDDRKSAKEMSAYLGGLLLGIDYIKNVHKQ